MRLSFLDLAPANAGSSVNGEFSARGAFFGVLAVAMAVGLAAKRPQRNTSQWLLRNSTTFRCAAHRHSHVQLHQFNLRYCAN